MAERVTAINPETFGSDSRISDYIHKPPWWLIVERGVVWWVRHYWLLLFVVGMVWLRSWLDVSWTWAGVLVLGALGVSGLAWVAGMLWVVGGRVRAGRVVAMVWKMAVVNYKWNRICFAAAVVARRSRSVPGIWLLHVSRGGRGVRGFVWSGRLGLPISRFEDEFVRDTVCASLPGAVAVRVEPVDAGRGWVEVLWTDPLAEVVEAAALVGGGEGGRIPFALDEDRRIVSLSPDRSLLIGGESGSGKSGVIWALLRGMQEVGLAHELHVIDPKGGIELGELAGYAGTVNYCKDSRDAPGLVHRVAQDMFKRMSGMSGRKVVISESSPLNVLIIDELLLIGSVLKEGIDGPLGQLLTQGRAAGYVVWACTQLGQKSVLGDLRDVFVQRICMAVRSSGVTNAVLGDGAEQDGALCSDIPQELPGIGYIYVEGQKGYRRFRAAYVSDSEIRAIVGENGGWKRPRRISSRRYAEEERASKMAFRRTPSPRYLARIESENRNTVIGNVVDDPHVELHVDTETDQ